LFSFEVGMFPGLLSFGREERMEFDIIRKIAALRGTTLEHEIARHNIGIIEKQLECGKPPPAASAEEREARRKAARKRGVDKARGKRQAARIVGIWTGGPTHCHRSSITRSNARHLRVFRAL
jgi:hypothetical protein